MNFFKVYAHGEAFDVDAFLATTALRPDYVWRRGDQRRYACVESRHPMSGLELVLGDGRTVALPEQQRIAVAYLSANSAALKGLAGYPGAAISLGLQYHLEPDSGTTAFALGPSAWLMWHCLDIGVSPTFDVSLDRPDEWEGELAAEPGGAPDTGRSIG